MSKIKAYIIFSKLIEIKSFTMNVAQRIFRKLLFGFYQVIDRFANLPRTADEGILGSVTLISV